MIQLHDCFYPFFIDKCVIQCAKKLDTSAWFRHAVCTMLNWWTKTRHQTYHGWLTPFWSFIFDQTMLVSAVYTKNKTFRVETKQILFISVWKCPNTKSALLLVCSLRKKGTNETLPYNQLPPEAVLGNSLGVVIVALALVVLKILSNQTWQRPEPRNEEAGYRVSSVCVCARACGGISSYVYNIYILLILLL